MWLFCLILAKIGTYKEWNSSVSDSMGTDCPVLKLLYVDRQTDGQVEACRCIFWTVHCENMIANRG